MTAYNTCRNCAVDKATCERRTKVSAGIKGLGLTSIKFTCADRQPLYRPGQRVGVTWPYYDPDCGWEDRLSLETWPATVISETGKGFLICVDDVPSDNELPAREYIKSQNLYCNVSAAKLASLDEPDHAICEHCESTPGVDGTVLGCWAIGGFDGMSPVANCLAIGIAARSDETRSGSAEGKSPAIAQKEAP